MPPPSRVGPGLTEERVVVRSAGERVEPALDIVIAGIAAEELRRRERSVAPKPSQPGALRARAKGRLRPYASRSKSELCGITPW